MISTAILHAIVVYLVTLLGFSINFHAFFAFLAGKNISREAIDAFVKHIWHCFGYFATVYILAYVAGRLAKATVLKWHLDIKFPWLSLHSDNFALFKCRSPEALAVYRDPDLENSLFVILDGLMMVGGKAWIYTGIVKKITETKTG